MKSWNGSHLLTTAGGATGTWTSPAGLQWCGTGGAAAGPQGGAAALQREEAHHHAGSGIAARARDGTGAGPGRGATDRDRNLQGITVVTDTEVTPNHLKDLRKVTKRVGEEMNKKQNPAHRSRTLSCSLMLSCLLHRTADSLLAALAVPFFYHLSHFVVLNFFIKGKLRILFM